MDFSENGDACLSRDGLLQELVGSPYEAVLLLDWTSSEVVACNDAAARMLRADGVEAVRGAAPWVPVPPYQPDGRPSEEKVSA
ncbi:MAG TPA: hypothetical protein VKC56_01980, partial [Gallionellaceae bacterium]|nr:hypothetical protein [Gallionellaceae bacterium]